MSVSPEQLDRIVAMLPTAESLRDISTALGLNSSDVRIAAKPFILLMRMTGQLPDCGCGRPRFHPYGCIATYRKSERLREGMPRNISAKLPKDVLDTAVAEALAKRATIVSLIVDGIPYKRIDRMLGMGESSSRQYRAYLTSEQMAERAKLDRRRNKRLGPSRDLAA